MITSKQKYSDLPFFISPNPFTGDFNLIKDISTIRQAMKNIILTNSGERPFDYLFGTSLYKNIFENLTYEVIMDIQTKIATTLRRYENRVDILNIKVKKSLVDEYTADITIFYQIPDIGISDAVTISVTRNR